MADSSLFQFVRRLLSGKPCDTSGPFTIELEGDRSERWTGMFADVRGVIRIRLDTGPDKAWRAAYSRQLDWMEKAKQAARERDEERAVVKQLALQLGTIRPLDVMEPGEDLSIGECGERFEAIARHLVATSPYRKEYEVGDPYP